MNFTFTPDVEAFRREVRSFLANNPPARFQLEGPDMGWGIGGWSRTFARKMADEGFTVLTWPQSRGGREKGIWHKLALWEELAYQQAPYASTTMAESMAHLVMESGTPQMQAEVLPRIARGETAFWLGFSEPNAGSDLLAVSTRASADGDSYILNGQKVWSSNAHLGEYGYVLARTDATVPAAKGLSMFFVSNRLPGLTIRPVINIGGYHYHNEVFFDNVRVPATCLVGQKNRGLNLMLRGLDHDRFWGRFAKASYCKSVLDEVVSYARNKGPSAVLRSRIADSVIEIETCRLLLYRAAWMMDTRQSLTYESCVPKAFADEMEQRLARTGMDVLGPNGQLLEGSSRAPLGGKLARLCQVTLGHSIAGGTSEIIRNTIAQRGLGLPRS